MSLYRVLKDYSDGRMRLRKGRVVDLDVGTADQVERDSAETIEALAEAEVAALEKLPVLADWRPEVAKPHAATGGGEAMHSGSAWGGPR